MIYLSRKSNLDKNNRISIVIKMIAECCYLKIRCKYKTNICSFNQERLLNRLELFDRSTRTQGRYQLEPIGSTIFRTQTRWALPLAQDRVMITSALVSFSPMLRSFCLVRIASKIVLNNFSHRHRSHNSSCIH